MSELVRRLCAPALGVALFAGLGAFAPMLLAAMGEGLAAHFQKGAGYLIQAGLWIACAFLVIRLLDVFLWDAVFGRLRGREVPRLLKDAVAIVILLFAAAGILGFVFGQSVTGVWATSGAISIVIGLALRSIILDIFSGLAINVDRSFSIGDYVELLDRQVANNVYGRIVEINWRTTRIETDDRRHIVVPNSKMGLTVLANYSVPSDISRFEVLFTLDYSVPPERAMRVLLAGAKAATGRNGVATHPEPAVIIGHTTPLGVEYRVRFWHRVTVMPPAGARHLVQLSILQHLSHAGLSIAYPKQDTYHAPMPPRQLEHEHHDDRARLLGGVDIFGTSLQPEELARLARDMAPRLFRTGATLMKEGETGATMLVVAEGLLEARARSEAGDVPLGHIQPGEFAGEMSLLTGEPRSATIVALTDTMVYEITREHVATLLAERPAIAEAISEVVALRRLNAASRLAEAGVAPDAGEVRRFSNQILHKMRFFFRHVMDRHQTSQGGRA
jgi:small-conductance mechanosensitive channel